MGAEPSVWLRRHLHLLVVADITGATLATVSSQIMFFGLDHAVLHVRSYQIPYLALVVVVVPAWLMVVTAAGGYDQGPFARPSAEARRIVSAGTHFLALMAVAYYIAHLEQLGRGFMVAIVPLATVFTLAGRLAARAQLDLHRARGHAVRHAVVMGPEANVTRFLSHLDGHPRAGLDAVAALVPRGDGTLLTASGTEVPVIGRPEQAVHVLSSAGADLLVVTGNLELGELRSLTWALGGTGVEVLVVPTVTQLTDQLEIHPMAGLPLLYLDHTSLPAPPSPIPITETPISVGGQSGNGYRPPS